jgi:SH3-like domain-containing protein
MQSGRVPRLGLLARIGFGGIVGALVLTAAVMLDIRFKQGDAAPAPSATARHDPPPAGPATPSPAGTKLAGIKLAAAKPKAASVKASAEDERSIASLLGVAPGDPAEDRTGSLPSTTAAPPTIGLGPVSGLPMPRFVSLKSDRINVRQGPTRDQRVAFIFQKAGLPVEVVAEFENWRRIRDSEGSEGWVLQTFLSGRRTALVAPWSKDRVIALHSQASETSAPVAMLQPGLLANIKECSSEWCRVVGAGFDGWIAQEHLWGAYPGETID